MFSYEFSEFSKNTFFYRTPPVAASEYPKIIKCSENFIEYFTHSGNCQMCARTFQGKKKVLHINDLSK